MTAQRCPECESALTYDRTIQVDMFGEMVNVQMYRCYECDLEWDSNALNDYAFRESEGTDYWGVDFDNAPPDGDE